MPNVQIAIQNGSNIYYPIIEGELSWETERKGVPGKITFTVLKDLDVRFQEGNAVMLQVDGKKIFYGFVFQKKRDKQQHIKVTVYDQLRYFKNKDTYVYGNKRLDELVRMIASDFRLKVGTLENTRFKIPSRIEQNKTIFDIVQTAHDLTLQNQGKMFVLYDDYGKITLKNVESMKLDLLIDEESGENFDYSSSIDGETYNKIKLSYENKDTGKREIYIAQDSKNINDWGVLQYFDTIKEGVNGKAQANALLQLYNQKTRNLSIKKAFGDTRVRGGSAVIVGLNLGDIIVQKYMMVEKVKHSFEESEHWMDLTLRGGEFIA
ncbi:XkdQ/YqbQ family protein [Cytobacillus gottheilii]|uniref:XkdQ/YqbQ family protein n=1 Tax=Cytobacillus gottheilii TaxID=859144 RepID=UPI001FE2C7CA|nr:hydrolase [Cytobacillus gottheilii]